DGGDWPSGSLGFKVNARATLATDKDVYPPGCVCLVDTDGVNVSGVEAPILRFMVDQDTGGGIRAPGRADIYMGEGDLAETLAGGQYAEGRLYYLFLR
ncbi:MAG: murein transglycosylase, partial [Actinomycetales bacterium]|nr:murein transglycosylase [Actinomycetales bacterium]